jgi:hypothetical protein
MKILAHTLKSQGRSDGALESMAKCDQMQKEWRDALKKVDVSSNLNRLVRLRLGISQDTHVTPVSDAGSVTDLRA